MLDNTKKIASFILVFTFHMLTGSLVAQDKGFLIPIPTNEEFCAALLEMLESDSKHRSGKILRDDFGKPSSYTKQEIDSVWKLQWELDNRNTESLIELTREYGWLSDERVNCPDLNIWLIFRHSQAKYYTVIDSLIEKEHEAGRLNTFHYELIKDHVTGKY